MRNGASKISTAQIGPRKDDESTLYIERVALDDSGIYSCKAHNKAGTMCSTVKITVRGKQYQNDEKWYCNFAAEQTGYLSHEKLQEVNVCFYMSTFK